MQTFHLSRRLISAERLNKKLEQIIKRKLHSIHERFHEDLLNQVWMEILIEHTELDVFLESEDLLRFVERVIKRAKRIQELESGRKSRSINSGKVQALRSEISDIKKKECPTQLEEIRIKLLKDEIRFIGNEYYPSVEQLSVVEDLLGITEPLFFNHPPIGRKKSSYLSYGPDGNAIDSLKVIDQVCNTPLLSNTGNTPTIGNQTLKLLKSHKPSFIPKTLDEASLLVCDWSNPHTGKTPNRGYKQNFAGGHLEGQTFYFNGGCPICLSSANCFQLYHDDRKGVKWKCWRFVSQSDLTTDLLPSVPKNMRTLAAIIDLQGHEDFDLHSLEKTLDRDP